MNVSAELALQLKTAGLQWTPSLHDFFSIPETEVDDRVFVLTDMMAGMEVLKGHRAIMFNGATEWALDYVLMMEALWIPTEAQVRIQLEQRLSTDSPLSLTRTSTEYVCEIQVAEAPLTFAAPTAADAYATALLSLL